GPQAPHPDGLGGTTLARRAGGSRRCRPSPSGRGCGGAGGEGYGATSITSNVSGRIDGRGRGRSGVGAGGGPNCAVGTNTSPVFSSTAIVRAPRAVGTVSEMLYSLGETSCTTVIVPSAPFDENAFCFFSSNAAPSTPLPMATDATT